MGADISDNAVDKYVANLMKEVDNWFEPIVSSSRRNQLIFVLSEALSLIGDYGLIWVLIAISLVIRRPRSILTIAKLMAISGFGSIFTTSLLKNLTNRNRPISAKAEDHGKMQSSITQSNHASRMVRAKWLRNPSSQSFPSGHTMAAFSTAFLIDDLGDFNGRLKLLAVLIGVSRVIVNDHYPTDVIAGGVLGILLAKFARKFLTDI